MNWLVLNVVLLFDVRFCSVVLDRLVSWLGERSWNWCVVSVFICVELSVVI